MLGCSFQARGISEVDMCIVNKTEGNSVHLDPSVLVSVCEGKFESISAFTMICRMWGMSVQKFWAGREVQIWFWKVIHGGKGALGRCGVEGVIDSFASRALMKKGEWLPWNLDCWGWTLILDVSFCRSRCRGTVAESLCRSFTYAWKYMKVYMPPHRGSWLVMMWKRPAL